MLMKWALRHSPKSTVDLKILIRFASVLEGQGRQTMSKLKDRVDESFGPRITARKLQSFRMYAKATPLDEGAEGDMVRQAIDVQS